MTQKASVYRCLGVYRWLKPADAPFSVPFGALAQEVHELGELHLGRICPRDIGEGHRPGATAADGNGEKASGDC